MAGQSLLSIRLLGQFSVELAARPVSGLAGDRPQSLLAYLLLHRNAPQSRRHVAYLLWPDSTEAQARSNLRNLFFTLRQALPDAERYLAADNSTLQWRPDAPFALDVAAFDQALADADRVAQDSQTASARLKQAIALYRGDLLPGNYDDWLLALREDYRNRFVEALRRHAGLVAAAGDYPAAIRSAQRYLLADPLNEPAYVQLMRLHALAGDRAAVQRLYQQCVQVLRRELEVDPAPATQQVYHELLRLAPARQGPGIEAAAMRAGQATAGTPPSVPAPTPSTPVASAATLAAPPAPGTGARPRPLPPPATPFLGRERELGQIAERLADSNCRLLTIVGPGGIGKTRLALQCAVGHQPVFADGVAYVSLVSVETEVQMAAALAAALNAPFLDTEPPFEQVVAALRGRELLLVLDNFEHLAPHSPFLSDLLAAVPGCKLLVTSREELALVEEWVFTLQGLPVPPDGATGESPALALFERSARRSRHDFVLEAADRPYAAQICQMVEGLPLAIELAASWVRLLSCAEIAAEMKRSLDFLAATQRNIPERHRSMRAVFDYSWRLLTEGEQAVLRRLAVFAGGFSREAAQAVADVDLALLLALAAKSLVQRIEQGRYSLHELVRQYALGELAQAGEQDSVLDRHLSYYIQLADAARAALYGPEQRTWLARLELEHDNLRATLEWAFATQPVVPARVAQGLHLVAQMPRFWNNRGHLREGTAWLERGLALCPACDAGVRADALNLLGWLINMLGEAERATAMQVESLALYETAGNRRGMAEALDSLGDIAWGQGDVAAARGYYGRCLVLRRELEDRSAIGLALYSLGRLEVDYGDPAVAEGLLREALALLRALDDRRGEALALNGLGRVALRVGQPAQAEPAVRSALAIFAELGNSVDIPECLEELALLAGARGDLTRAAQLLGSAIALRSSTGASVALDEQDLAALLLQITDNPAFLAALAGGRAMTQDQAVAVALGSDAP